MIDDEAQDQDALAAEYVLGTLDADERAQAQALMWVNPEFATLVRQWERRLGELHAMADAIEPPAPIWTAIKTQIEALTSKSDAAAEGAAAPAFAAAAAPAAPTG